MKTNFAASRTAAAVLLLLNLSSAGAKEIFQRAEDFSASAGQGQDTHRHGGLFAPESARWAYYLIPENAKVASPDDGPLHPSQWIPLSGFVNREVKKHFVLHDFRVDQRGVSLTWNHNATHPKTALAKARLIAVFTAPESGTYSIEGEMLWQSTHPHRVTSAGLEVVKLMGETSQTTLLFSSTLAAPEAMEEPMPVPGFADTAALKGIALKRGDRLGFIWQSDAANYRRIEGIDHGIRIVWEEGNKREYSKKERQDAAALQRFFGLLDLTGPAQASLRGHVAAGEFREAMSAYMHILAGRAGKLPGVRPYSYWLYGITDANRLLKGDLDFSRYGDMASHLTVHIGPPGETSFFQVAGDYSTTLRDISSMHWVTKYAEAYEKTGDPKFLHAWLTTWDDFFQNWEAQYATVRKTPGQMGLDPNVVSNVKGLDWLNAQLYLAWRIEAFYQGLAAVLLKAKEVDALSTIDEIQFARLITGITTKDATRARSWLGRANSLVPNQIRHLGRSLFQLSVFLPEVRESTWWRDESLPLYFLTHQPDGSDREQSLNYFDNSLPALLQALALLPDTPEKESIVDDLKRRNATRDRFLPSLARPDGILPSVGKNNHWRQYGQTAPLTPPSRDFTSIFFPYGGYAVMRDGWQPDSHYLFMKTSRPAIGHWRSQEGGLQLSAFGRNLLISSVGELYDSREENMGWSAYWYSAAGQNTILVDGRSPTMRRWVDLPPDNGLWHTSALYDVAETDINSGYGGGNIFSNRPGIKAVPLGEAEITDTTHHRRVIFLRKLGAWIIIDTVESQTPRRITQTWNFGPEFKQNEVSIDPEKKRFKTFQADGANLSIYQFSSSALHYDNFYGVYGEKGVFGWVGILKDPKTRAYTPSMDIHTTWQNTGQRTVVSLLIPTAPGKNDALEIKDISDGAMTGFELKSRDGHRVSFRHGNVAAPISIGPVNAIAKALLVETPPGREANGIVFGAQTFNGSSAATENFEFTASSSSSSSWTRWWRRESSYSILPITAPATFEWATTQQKTFPLWHHHSTGPKP